MLVTVKYFGKLVEVTGKQSEQISFNDETNVKQVLTILSGKYTTLKNETFKIALNQNFCAGSEEIKMDCEMALLPPFAGG